ncbi:hypothetical protein OG884_03220 [Streptosporangium sp. NBC_01755]|uniref:hypothetical protein n=1 Tax=unclassified Streptosporangium TaxID=2632669 RepID=UPI002DD96362|nr:MULTISPECIES: hypothetical protein [unclassified Streptosporangium]WSA27565.1 hypothetical protein OIE13_06735 [Streptosporangium sp. NBC_01810]WSD00964.1 hypothetical protein OG884_03220 [Streptosporangium sp. NBC_01755]
MNSESCAYIDESMRVGAGLYVLAAAVVPNHQAVTYRAALRALLLSKQPRLHWRDERPKRRLEIVYALAELSLDVIAVVGTDMPSSKQKRARRKCMDRLYWRLAQRRVPHVIMEGRGQAGNKEDLDMVNALRAQNMLPDEMRVEWADPLCDELLWLPDILAGVIAAAAAGDTALLGILEEGVIVDRLRCD